MQSKGYTVYIVASRTRVLYVGVTSNLTRRIWEHKTHKIKGFTDRYNCTFLVWAELHPDPHAAIEREKQIKGWVRKKKIALIQSENPDWNDLAEAWWPEDLILEERRKNGDLRV